MAKNEEHKSDPKLHDAAQKLGSAGGKVGGAARAKKLSAKERSEIARMGGLARDSKAGVKGKKRAEEKTKKQRGEGKK